MMEPGQSASDSFPSASGQLHQIQKKHDNFRFESEKNMIIFDLNPKSRLP